MGKQVKEIPREKPFLFEITEVKEVSGLGVALIGTVIKGEINSREGLQIFDGESLRYEGPFGVEFHKPDDVQVLMLPAAASGLIAAGMTARSAGL